MKVGISDFRDVKKGDVLLFLHKESSERNYVSVVIKKRGKMIVDQYFQILDENYELKYMGISNLFEINDVCYNLYQCKGKMKERYLLKFTLSIL